MPALKGKKEQRLKMIEEALLDIALAVEFGGEYKKGLYQKIGSMVFMVFMGKSLPKAPKPKRGKK